MFDAHYDLVLRTLRRYGFEAAAAADLVQQTYLVAVERIAFIEPGRERAFLMGTALRIARAARRAAARVRPEGDLDDRLQVPSLAESQTATVELLDQILAKLDPNLVEVFVLFHVEEFTAPEIAQALELPVGTVASRVRRAREEFRAAAARLAHQFRREEDGR